MPSEYACTFLRAACESPTRSSASATRARRVRARRVPVGGVEAAQVRLAREVGRERRPLDERADAGQHRVDVPRHVGAEHARVARARRDEAEQHPDRGGLARAVRPEEPEHGAARHRQVEAVDGRSGDRKRLVRPCVSIARSGTRGARQRPLAAASSRRSGVTAPTNTRPSSAKSTLTSDVGEQASAVDAVGSGCRASRMPRRGRSPHRRRPPSPRRCRRPSCRRRPSRRRPAVRAASPAGSTTTVDQPSPITCGRGILSGAVAPSASASAFHCSSSATVGTGTSCSVTVGALGRRELEHRRIGRLERRRR